MGIIEDARSTHDEGLALVARRPRGSLTPDNPTHQRMMELIRFREEEVGWANLIGDDIRSLGEGSFAAWMAIIPPDHALLGTQRVIFEATTNFGPYLLLIKPSKISRTWAGIGQLHEAGHLWDWARGYESPNSTGREWARGEIRAHEVELEAANLLSGGRYSQRLRDFADAEQLVPVEELLSLVEAGNGTLARLERIDSMISPEKPRSREEAAFRYGSHIYSLGLLLLEGWGSRPVSLSEKEAFALNLREIMLGQGRSGSIS